MKKSIVALLHIGFWACYFLLVIVILAVLLQDSEDERLIEYYIKFFCCLAILPGLITFYAFYWLLFPKYIQRKKYLPAVLMGTLIAMVAGLVGFVLVQAVYEGTCVDSSVGTQVGSFFFITFVALLSGIVALVIKGFVTWLDEIKLKETLKAQNHEMEMALIRSQLDPHFLFNTINNIDVLILKDANAASAYLNQLSDIMRFMLYETKTDQILLSKELAYIEKYIALQRIRTYNADYVHFSVCGHTGAKTIAPMVFIPFIENAFKHTNNKKIENAIEITISITHKCIQFVCENKYKPKGNIQADHNGLGNNLIQKRLQLLYPNQHTLVTSNHNHIYRVNLTIDNG